ncbi:hypothetical protein I3900191A7_04990 [Clostridium baratii]|uniref:Uncharacterized protein n=2 Tax=Clostridium TaxID=1485 RepID=A0ABN1LS66_9CLOT|nr:hypothetical protein [Clostridium baratii]AQM59885.1 hypothetical protein NPD11_1356 [Clostridium baratii]KJU73169.1 hypothetical protein UC77_00500 [Clostridium baratii]MBS6041684.1 hypothetical protein [Clostridium baratii]MBT9831004.1 hypothetical protein [Clostridium baratii]MDY3208403.1 hypothetical protein [Clostridium baratii]
MNRYIQKVISLLLVILITLLTFNHYKILVYSNTLQDVFSFLTLALILISSVNVINISKSGLNKFINYIILISAVTGGILLIIDYKTKIVVYICLLFTIVYAIMDMLYKKA